MNRQRVPGNGRPVDKQQLLQTGIPVSPVTAGEPAKIALSSLGLGKATHGMMPLVAVPGYLFVNGSMYCSFIEHVYSIYFDIQRFK